MMMMMTNCVFQVLTYLLVVGMTPESTLCQYSSILIHSWMIFTNLAWIHCASAERWRANEATLCSLFSEEGCASADPEQKLITGSTGFQEDVAMGEEDLTLTTFIG